MCVCAAEKAMTPKDLLVVSAYVPLVVAIALRSERRAVMRPSAACRVLTAVVVVLLLLLPAVATAQWTAIRALPQPQRTSAGLVYAARDVALAVSVVSPEIVRIRLESAAAAKGRYGETSPRPADDPRASAGERRGRFGRDHSYAVIPGKAAPPPLSVRVGPRESSIDTGAVRVVIRQDPFQLEILSRDGGSLDADDTTFGTAFAGSSIRTWKRLRDDEYVYGLGEKTGRLNKRGKQLGGYTYVMWNSDTFAYDASIDPIYASVPIYLVLRQGRAHGIFLDNTFRSSFDVGHTSPGVLSFGVEGGELDYYFIDGPTPKDVIRRYTDLTGRMPLPPLWALGYHQCRWSYYPDSQVRFIADNFRQRRIPADVIWLDIHYQDGYKPFTWDRERFPDPAGLVRHLRAQGFRVVTIVDPHPKKEVGYAPYDSGLAGGHFVTRPDGSVYEAPVWPSQAARGPGPSVFPDFSRPATREWWGSLYKPFLDLGIAGIWNDMNEPAVFVPPTGTFPLDVRHDNEGQPTDHREIHNVYGQLMSRATYEGLRRLHPNERSFVLTRATFAGGQRYAALWPGDNTSTWSALADSIAMLAGLGLSGFPFVGTDIGGFAGVPSAELYEDDGSSMAYLKGEFTIRRVEWSSARTEARIVVKTTSEGRGVARRSRTRLALRSDLSPAHVHAGMSALNQLDERSWTDGLPGWRYRAGFVEMRLPHGAVETDVTIEFTQAAEPAPPLTTVDSRQPM